jgi:1-acyl-sn-glycerol-3-phosphate acyltransferase
MSVQTLPAHATRPGAWLMARSAAFNTAALVWMVAMVLIAVPCLLLPRGAVLSISRLWMGGVQFLLRHLVGLTHEVRGLDRAPGTPAIYAFKHQSAWETLVTHLVVPDAAIALKSELEQVPLFGWSVRRAGMIGVDRGGGTKALRSLVAGARDAFARGVSVIIFPEGHRIAPGRHVPYQPGVAALYTQLKQPVVPVAHNSGLFWGRRSFVKRPGRIVLEFLEPIEPGLDRKAFMAELHQRLEGACDRLIEEAGGLGPRS